jgi:hypothetical protein
VPWLYHFCYRLEHHYFLEISLKDWLWFWIAAPLVGGFLRLWGWGAAIPLSLLAALLLAGIEWARRQHEWLFEPAALAMEDAQAPIRVDEQTPGWACGAFSVNDRTRRVTGERALYSFVPSREHVAMAYVRRTRFLLLGRSLKGDVGWWYVFFRPRHVERVRTGFLSWERQKRPALAIRYRSEPPIDEAPQPTRRGCWVSIPLIRGLLLLARRRARAAGRMEVGEVYLAFEDQATVGRALDDLRRDVDAAAFRDLG